MPFREKLGQKFDHVQSRLDQTLNKIAHHEPSQPAQPTGYQSYGGSTQQKYPSGTAGSQPSATAPRPRPVSEGGYSGPVVAGKSPQPQSSSFFGSAPGEFDSRRPLYRGPTPEKPSQPARPVSQSNTHAERPATEPYISSGSRSRFSVLSAASAGSKPSNTPIPPGSSTFPGPSARPPSLAVPPLAAPGAGSAAAYDAQKPSIPSQVSSDDVIRATSSTVPPRRAKPPALGSADVMPGMVGGLAAHRWAHKLYNVGSAEPPVSDVVLVPEVALRIFRSSTYIGVYLYAPAPLPPLRFSVETPSGVVIAESELIFPDSEATSWGFKEFAKVDVLLQKLAKEDAKFCVLVVDGTGLLSPAMAGSAAPTSSNDRPKAPLSRYESFTTSDYTSSTPYSASAAR